LPHGLEGGRQEQRVTFNRADADDMPVYIDLGLDNDHSTDASL
jgi:hypothetical protein